VALSSCATVVISRSGIWGIASAASEGRRGVSRGGWGACGGDVKDSRAEGCG
jgi:hypothetical protein